MPRKLKEYQGTFEVFDVGHRRLRNGNKLRVVLEAPYDKAEEGKLLSLLFLQASVALTEKLPEPALPLEEEPEGSGGDEE